MSDQTSQGMIRDRPSDPNFTKLPFTKKERAKQHARQRRAWLIDLANHSTAWDRLAVLEGDAATAYASEQDADAKLEKARELNTYRAQMEETKRHIDGLQSLIDATEKAAKKLDPGVNLDQPDTANEFRQQRS